MNKIIDINMDLVDDEILDSTVQMNMNTQINTQINFNQAGCQTKADSSQVKKKFRKNGSFLK